MIRYEYVNWEFSKNCDEDPHGFRMNSLLCQLEANQSTQGFSFHLQRDDNFHEYTYTDTVTEVIYKSWEWVTRKYGFSLGSTCSSALEYGIKCSYLSIIKSSRLHQCCIWFLEIHSSRFVNRILDTLSWYSSMTSRMNKCIDF